MEQLQQGLSEVKDIRVKLESRIWLGDDRTEMEDIKAIKEEISSVVSDLVIDEKRQDEFKEQLGKVKFTPISIPMVVTTRNDYERERLAQDLSEIRKSAFLRGNSELIGMVKSLEKYFERAIGRGSVKSVSGESSSNTMNGSNNNGAILGNNNSGNKTIVNNFYGDVSVTKELREELNHMEIESSIKEEIKKELDKIDDAKKQGKSVKEHISKIMGKVGMLWEVGKKFIPALLELGNEA